ncbi:DUF397 domain-containing protein [Nocardiopsis coralliicola]
MTEHLAWHKSTYSSSKGGDCVEAAPDPVRGGPHGVLLRDSRHPLRAVLRLPPAEWAAFVSAAQQRRL